MAKKAYIGVDGSAEKVKKGYVGVDSVARKIRKAYIGIGGVARPCWSGGEISYYGYLPPMSGCPTETYGLTIKRFAVLTGNGGLWAYDASLTVHNAANASNIGWCAASVYNGAYVIVGGGYLITKAYAFDEDLTYHSVPELGVSGEYIGGARAGDYGIMSGWGIAEAYTQSLTKVAIGSQSVRRNAMGLASTKDYAIFAGGRSGDYGSTVYATVEAYDASLVRTIPETLSAARDYACSGGSSELALFAGGESGAESSRTQKANVDVYDNQLSKHTVQSLFQARGRSQAVWVEPLFVVAGGTGAGAATEVYDEELVHTSADPLAAGRRAPSCAAVGNYAVIGGGHRSQDGYTTTAEAYLVN